MQRKVLRRRGFYGNVYRPSFFKLNAYQNKKRYNIVQFQSCIRNVMNCQIIKDIIQNIVFIEAM